MRIKGFLVASTIFMAATLGGAGCTILYPDGYTPPTGIFYQNIMLNRTVSPATELGAKSGESCAYSVMALYASGDASVQAAAAAGGIRTIRAVDYRKMSALGVVYSKVCTIVHGD